MKKADFIGKAALADAATAPLLHGIRCTEAEPLISAPVAVGRAEIGWISAGAWSPFLDCGIGFVRVNDPEYGPGTQVEVTGTDGKTYAAGIVDLPFYDAEKRIPRGLVTKVPERC
jgi:aminomethyltransferase